MDSEVLARIEALYTMITEAWGVPLGNEKCIIDRDRALSLLDEIKERLPGEMAEAKRIVVSRDEYVGNAQREADAIRKSAEEHAQELIDEQEIVRLAKKRSGEILSTAEKRTRELYRVVNAYVDDTLRRTEEAINSAMTEVRTSRAAFRDATANMARAGRTEQQNDGQQE